jgi:four helix bundle protein
MDLAERCYQMTREFPRDELYGMTSQIRRASVSVAANIAEGHGREQAGAFVQFLRIAQGSLKELETHLMLSARVSLAPELSVSKLLGRSDELGRMLRALVRSLQSKSGGAQASK